MEFFEQYPIVKDLLLMVGIFLFSAIMHYVTKRYVLRFIKLFVRQTPFKWDDRFEEEGVFDSLPQLVPAIIIHQGFAHIPVLTNFMQRAATVWVIFIVLKFIDKALSAVLQIYNTHEVSTKRSITTYVQVIKLFLYIVAGIWAISIFFDTDPWIFLSGLGAITAVLMLVFQDTILGFVATLRINGNDLLRVGDWLDAPAFDADGFVIEIALHTIRVQNWDRTITSIPSHKLVSSSFKNWRGMYESGGRRIKRSFLIDQTSVKFCSPEMIEKFRKIHVLKDYIDQKESEIAEYNKLHGIDDSVVVNGRRMTNLGTLRAYITAYLRSHPGIHQELTFLIRQMQPTRDGIPMEVYVFTSTTQWADYEGIQADVFDHILAVIHEFDLRIAQDPTGYDLRQLKVNSNLDFQKGVE